MPTHLPDVWLFKAYMTWPATTNEQPKWWCCPRANDLSPAFKWAAAQQLREYFLGQGASTHPLTHLLHVTLALLRPGNRMLKSVHYWWRGSKTASSVKDTIPAILLLWDCDRLWRPWEAGRKRTCKGKTCLGSSRRNWLSAGFAAGSEAWGIKAAQQVPP